eukprot:m.65372 g.65372  ORF g.65372 m.65372 type:complete len:77 (+) comp8149_c2_seq1:4660-4890(+)
MSNLSRKIMAKRNIDAVVLCLLVVYIYFLLLHLLRECWNLRKEGGWVVFRSSTFSRFVSKLIIKERREITTSSHTT